MEKRLSPRAVGPSPETVKKKRQVEEQAAEADGGGQGDASLVGAGAEPDVVCDEPAPATELSLRREPLEDSEGPKGGGGKEAKEGQAGRQEKPTILDKIYNYMTSPFRGILQPGQGVPAQAAMEEEQCWSESGMAVHEQLNSLIESVHQLKQVVDHRRCVAPRSPA